MSRNEAAQSYKTAIHKTTQRRKQERNCPLMSDHEDDNLEEYGPALGRQMGCRVRVMVFSEKKCMSIGMQRRAVGLDCPIRLTRSSREEREDQNVKLKSEVA